ADQEGEQTGDDQRPTDGGGAGIETRMAVGGGEREPPVAYLDRTDQMKVPLIVAVIPAPSSEFITAVERRRDARVRTAVLSDRPPVPGREDDAVGADHLGFPQVGADRDRPQGIPDLLAGGAGAGSPP